jgi:hypothetical protein
MEKHVTVLGVLYIAFSALGILATIIVFTAVVGGGLISGDSEAMAITAIVGPAIAFFLINVRYRTVHVAVAYSHLMWL